MVKNNMLDLEVPIAPRKHIILSLLPLHKVV